MPNIVKFQDQALELIERDNRPWLRGNQIGLALGYQHAILSIGKLYRDNRDEFTADMTAVLKLPTAGGAQNVRVFSPRGAHLLAMFARTPRAKAFRRWVLDVLDKEVATAAEPQPPQPAPATFGNKALRPAALDIRMKVETVTLTLPTRGTGPARVKIVGMPLMNHRLSSSAKAEIESFMPPRQAEALVEEIGRLMAGGKRTDLDAISFQ